MKKAYIFLIVTLVVASCTSQPRPSPEALVKGIQSRQERISILAKECEDEVYGRHLQISTPHQQNFRDRTHIIATRSDCKALAETIRDSKSATEIESSYKQCLTEAEKGRGRAGRPKQGHITRQKSLCVALYNERRE